MSSTAACSSRDAPSAESWQLAAAQAAQRLHELSMPPRPETPPVQVLRSSQLDALRLDRELAAMLQEQLSKLFAYFSPGAVVDLEPEISALLAFLVFWLSVWQGRATPGSELLNLRYRNELALVTSPESVGRTGAEGPGLSALQRILFGIGTVGLPYAWARLGRGMHGADDWAPQGDGDPYGSHDNDSDDRGGRERGRGAGADWRRAARHGVRVCEAAVCGATLLNSWVFLWRGDYRTLLERLLGARLVWRQTNMTRIISFEYLNRQLVWQELSEALLFVLPMLSGLAPSWRRTMTRLLPRPATASQQGAAGSSGATAGSAEGPEGSREQALEQPGPCPVCSSSDILLPLQALPCRHVFCYYCLRAHCEADRLYACPIDGQRVRAMKRWMRRVPGAEGT